MAGESVGERARRRTPTADLDKRGDAPSPRLAEIIEAASHEFARAGFAGASMQSIADSVGMLKGSLYHYIGTKSDLLFFVVRDVANGLLVEVESDLDETDDPESRLRSLVERHIRYNTNNLVKAKVAIRESYALSESHREQFKNLQDKYERLIRRVISDGQAAGQFDESISPTLAAMAILSVCNYVHEWYRPAGNMSADQIATALTRIAMCGIVPIHRSSSLSQRDI